MRHTNDKLLIARVMLLDDRRAFGTLVERHQSAVRRFFLHQTNGDEMLTDDLSQETFIKLYYSIKQFKGLSSFSTYLYRIAYNVLQDYMRRHKPTESIEQAPDIGSSSPPDLQIDLIQALQQLSPTERSIVTLYYIDDYKIEDITRIVQMPQGTVKSHLHRARNKMYEYLKANGYE